MAKRGGYQIVDFKGVDLSDGEEHIIDGIYRAAGLIYKKAALVSGLVVDESGVLPDFFATINTSGLDWDLVVPQGDITIMEGDEVVFVAAESGDSDD